MLLIYYIMSVAAAIVIAIPDITHAYRYLSRYLVALVIYSLVRFYSELIDHEYVRNPFYK